MGNVSLVSPAVPKGVVAEEAIMMVEEEEAVRQEEEALPAAEILISLPRVLFTRDRITVVTVVLNRTVP